MNDESTVFTSEQFRIQAMELREAQAKLQSQTQTQTQAAEPCINPYDPFENETEFHDYNEDYGTIVPQIRIPGCKLPYFPNKREKKNIRRYYHVAGYGLLMHFLLSNFLAIVVYLAAGTGLTLFDTARAEGGLPENYDALLNTYMENSSISMAVNVIALMFANVLVAVLGLKLTGIEIPSLFRTNTYKKHEILQFCTIGIALQALTGMLATVVSDFFEKAGVTLFEPDFSTGTDCRKIILTLVYTCIVAPITEELFFRGFLLKSLSRVSQRFGIILSAFLFGLFHENVAQFLLAFPVGIFLGYLAVRCNSLIPTIIVHMAVNSMSECFDLLDTFGLDTLYNVMDWGYLILVVIGILFLIRMLLQERIPKATPRQAERGLRLSLTSIPLVAAIVIHCLMTVSYIK